jgi:Rieske Fe-S protein
MERRNFIRSACRICLLGAAGAAIASELSSCSPATTGSIAYKPIAKNNMLEVPLSIFEQKSFQIISPTNFEYEIAIEKTDASNYKALLLKCTHYDNQLTPTGSGYTCSLHGSKFDKEGNVINGPAAHALKQLKTQLTNTSLLINI